MTSDVVFLFSSKLENPSRFFQGYFFQKADYVYGQAGFEAFCQTRRIRRPVREDGCYIQAEETRSGYRFSADFSGFKKIFYFWDGGFWAVSNSLYRLAEHLSQNGYPVRPNVCQLAAAAAEGTFYPSGRGSFFSQMTSFDTIVRGIRLAPIDCTLRIGSAGARVEKEICQATDDDYRGQLGRFLGTWIGRLETLMQQDPLQISCDLTGGLDTRTIFALLLCALRRSGSEIDDHIRFHTGGGGYLARRDRNVASSLCKYAGRALNGRLARKPKWLRGKDSYLRWRDLCLGVYHPIYFPNTSPSAEIIYLGGGGGENHRRFYSQFLDAPSADSFVARRTRDIKLRSTRPDFELALQQAIDSIMDRAPENLDAMECHYRHFRNRFHSGRQPQYAVTYQPLASKLLDGITAVGREAPFPNGLLHYDILYNLQPELLEIPFDKLRKLPGRNVRKHLTSLSTYSIPSGNRFIEDSRVSRPKRRKNEASAIDHLQEDFARAKNGFATEFLGKRYVRRAERSMQRAARTGSFSGPTRSKRVAVVVACGMFDS